MTSAIGLSSTICRSDDALDHEVDQTVIVANIETGTYLGLQRVSLDIWKRLAGPRTVAALCEDLERTYAVDHETCVTEVIGFLRDMAREGVIRVVDSPTR